MGITSHPVFVPSRSSQHRNVQLAWRSAPLFYGLNKSFMFHYARSWRAFLVDVREHRQLSWQYIAAEASTEIAVQVCKRINISPWDSLAFLTSTAIFWLWRLLVMSSTVSEDLTVQPPLVLVPAFYQCCKGPFSLGSYEGTADLIHSSRRPRQINLRCRWTDCVRQDRRVSITLVLRDNSLGHTASPFRVLLPLLTSPCVSCCIYVCCR